MKNYFLGGLGAVFTFGVIYLIFFSGYIAFFAADQINGQAEDLSLSYAQQVSLQDSIIQPLYRSKAEWRNILSADQFRILREKGTERAYSSPLLKEKRKGVFTCAACELPLFASQTMFDSRTGWPSFYDKIHPAHIKNVPDNSYGMRRTEVVCARCDGHLGHVFDDGPRPTGLRYCINGLALDFVPD